MANAIHPAHELQLAKEAVFRLLKIRLRSEKEIKDKLRQKRFSGEVINQTINYFKEKEFLDDRQFAKGWIRSRLNKPFGAKRIVFELKQKGINETLIEEEIKEATAQHEEFDVILQIAQRRTTKYIHLDKLKAKKRILDYLQRRGFSYHLILKALEELDKK